MDPTTDRPNRPLTIKCNYDSSTRRVAFPSASACQLHSVRARVEETFHLSALSFALTYTDDNGEDFSIRNEADLTEAILYFASGEDDGPGGSLQRITLRLDVVVEYDGPSLSDTSSLRSFESGTGTGTGDEEASESSWRSSSYYTHSTRRTAGGLEDVDEEEDLEERMTVMGLQEPREVPAGPSSGLVQSELGSRWLREQSSLARRKGGSTLGKARRMSRDEEEDYDSDQEMGDLNLVRDAKGKYYYAYGSEGSSSVSGDYNDTRSLASPSPRPDIPVTGLAIEPGAPPVLAPDCSACGIRLDYMRYVCTTCGEGDLWKENAPGRLPPARISPGLTDGETDSDFTEQPDGEGSGSYTEYDPRPRSQSTATRASMEAVNGGLPTPPGSPMVRPAVQTGYELCPACIEEHGIAHAKAAGKVARVDSGATRRGRRSARHSFREKIWGLEGWTDIEYNDDIECTICHTHLKRNRFRCVSCPKFDMCRACYQRVAEIHPAHAFLSLPDQALAVPELDQEALAAPDIARPIRHPGAFCHNCLQDIVGPRFHCAVCPSWDLCIQCEGISAASGGHTPDHIMMKIPVPIAATQVEAVSRRARERWLRDSAAASPRPPSPSNETVYAAVAPGRSDSFDHRCRCRGCNEWILGKRFQCANCPSEPESYSLCSICELRSYRLHTPLHVFLKFDRPAHHPVSSPHPLLPILLRNGAGDVPPGTTLNPRDASAYLQHVLHKETLCDIHSDQIRGVWLRCAHCPAGFDICSEAEAGADHDPTHVFVVFKARVDMGKFRDLANLGGDRPRALLQQAVYRS